MADRLSRPALVRRNPHHLAGRLGQDIHRGAVLARRASELEHLTAFGAARAFYHTDNDRDPAGEKGVNYSRARRIDIAMRERKVRTVDMVGQVDGIYLEPVPPRAAPADTTRPDTATVRRPAAARPSPRPGRAP